MGCFEKKSTGNCTQFFQHLFVEYLEEDFDPNEQDYEFYIDSILPAIKKTIASKSGVYLDENTKYRVFKKPDNEIEVECTTSDGKVFTVEMVIDPLQQGSTSPSVSYPHLRHAYGPLLLGTASSAVTSTLPSKSM